MGKTALGTGSWPLDGVSLAISSLAFMRTHSKLCGLANVFMSF